MLVDGLLGDRASSIFEKLVDCVAALALFYDALFEASFYFRFVNQGDGELLG